MEDEQAAIDAVLKFAVLALAVGAVLGLVTFFGIRLLGVGGGADSSSDNPVAGGPAPSALPTVALSSKGAGNGSDEPSESPSTTAPPSGMLQLNANPGQVAPGQRINLTGSYQGQDNVQLQVQRREGGTWTQFADVQVPVRVGTFATYIITSRTGSQQFRVFDPGASKGSNTVTVSVG